MHLSPNGTAQMPLGNVVHVGCGAFTVQGALVNVLLWCLPAWFVYPVTLYHINCFILFFEAIENGLISTISSKICHLYLLQG